MNSYWNHEHTTSCVTVSGHCNESSIPDSASCFLHILTEHTSNRPFLQVRPIALHGCTGCTCTSTREPAQQLHKLSPALLDLGVPLASSAASADKPSEWTLCSVDAEHNLLDGSAAHWARLWTASSVVELCTCFADTPAQRAMSAIFACRCSGTATKQSKASAMCTCAA